VAFDLINRVYQHRNDLVDGFTKEYGVHQLAWYEVQASSQAAVVREKQIKKWNRQWKLELIEKLNPEWEDLYLDVTQQTGFPLSRE
jgi:putative endonuclease